MFNVKRVNVFLNALFHFSLNFYYKYQIMENQFLTIINVKV